MLGGRAIIGNLKKEEKMMWQKLIVLLFLLLPISVAQAATPSLVGGSGHSLYLSSDGTVSAWGWNEYGQLGNGTSGGRSTSPVAVTGLTNVISVAAGYAYSVALKNDGTVWTWGSNDMGQLGLGTKSSTATQNSPAQVPNLSNIVAIAANPSGSHTVALKSDGSVYIWGANGHGQHCDSASYQSYRSSPYQISALSGATDVATSGAAIFVIRQEGVIACGGGGNSTGILGNGTITQTLTPVSISSLGNIKSLAGGNDHMLALKSDGTVWAWGENDKGQLGDGSTATRSTPVQVSGLTGVIDIAAGARHSLAIKVDGSLASWGADAFGQLGDNSVTDRKTPYIIASTNVYALGAGVSHSLALQTNGTLWAKGDNSNGQLGNGSLTPPTNSLPTASFNYILFPSSGTLPITGGGVNIVLRDTSSDSDGSLVAWAWRVENSIGAVVCSSSSKDNDSCFVNTQGTYTIYFTVTDDRGATKDAAPKTVNISAAQNQTPQADFTMQAEGEGNLYLDGSRSRDPDGTIYSYKWSISPTSGVFMRENGSGIYQHAQFATPGTYTISLTVTDDKGATNTKQSTWQVSLSAPSPDFALYPDGLSVKVDASNSKATSASIASYKWTASNGQSATCDSQYTDCKVANFIFTQGGLIKITLLVTDTRGVSASISKDITVAVKPKLPTSIFINSSSSALQEGTISKFTADAIFSDGSKQAVIPIWSIDVGTSRFSVYPSIDSNGNLSTGKLYADAAITITAKYSVDAISVPITVSITITIKKSNSTLAAPQITINPPSPVPAGTTVTLSFPPVTGAKSYNLYYGTASGKYDASTPVQFSNSFTVQANWDLYVVVKVVDSNGVEGVASNEVHIVAAKATGINQLILSTALLDFSDSELNTSSAEKIVLTNKGGSSVTFKKMAISGADATSFSQTTTCGSTLSSNASCEVSVVFTPNQVGDKVAVMDIDIGESANYTVALTGFGDLLGDQKAEFEVVEIGATSDYSLSFTLNPQPDSVTGKVFISYLMKSKYAFLTSRGWEWYDPAKATKPITDFFYSNGALDGLSATVIKNVNLKTLPTGKLAVAYIDQNGRLRASTLMAFKEGRAINAVRSASSSNGFSDWFSMCQDYDLRCFTFEKDGVSKTQIDDTLQPPVRGLASFVIKHHFVHYESGGVHLTKAIASASLAALAYWPKDNAATDNMAEYVKQTGIGKLDFVFVDYSDKGTYSRSYKDIDRNDAKYSYTPSTDGNKKALGFQFLTGRIISKAAGAIRPEIEAVGKRGHIEYFVAIRGTDNGLDLDLDILGAKRRTDFRNLGAEYPVHAGFSFYADEVIDRDEFKEVIKRLNGKLCKKVFSCGLTIVGHSLGGAAATLVRAHLVKEFIDRRSSIKPEQIEAYTFGSPIPFASKKNGTVPSLQVFSDNSYRFVNTSDPVPKAGITSGDCTARMDSKCHVGKQYYFYDDGDEYGYIDIDAGEKLETGFGVVDSDGFLSTHAITSYIGILDAFKKTKKGDEVTKGAVRRFF